MSGKDIIVCDNGTYSLKCGFSGQIFPTSIVRSMVGRKFDENEILFGNEAEHERQNLQISYPIENGIIKSWSDMELLWDYTFHERLGIKNTVGKSVLLTEPIMNPHQNRKKMGEIMFEKFQFGRVYVSTQTVLVLYALGIMTGVIVDLGEGITQIVPVYEGCALPSVKRLDIGGSDITKRLNQLISDENIFYNEIIDFEMYRHLKEKFCYVAYDLKIEEQLAMETTNLFVEYELPDGNILQLEDERCLAPEILFDPSLVGRDYPGIHQSLFNSINDCDGDDIKSDLFKHILLSGGTSMLPGFRSRLKKEVTLLHEKKWPSKKKVFSPIRVEDPPKRNHLIFEGGSVLAGVIKDQDSDWITKAEYDEKGDAIMMKRLNF